MRTGWLAWMFYGLLGVLLPFTIVALSVVLDADKVASNISMILMGLYLHNFFFLKVVPLEGERSWAITVAIFAVYIISYFSIGVLDPPVRPDLTKVDTNNCQSPEYPPGYKSKVPGGLGRGVCSAVTYWYKFQPDAKKLLDLGLKNSEGSIFSSVGDLYRELTSKTQDYKAYEVFEQEVVEFIIRSLTDATIDSLAPNATAGQRKRCYNSVIKYFCSLVFQPCTADCRQQVKACTSPCLTVLDDCSNAPVVYGVTGPGSFVREGKDWTRTTAGYMEAISLFRDLQSKAWSEKCQSDMFAREGERCSALPFVANETSDGACNLQHQSAVKAENAAKIGSYEEKKKEYEAEKKHRKNAQFSLHFVVLFCNIVGLVSLRGIAGEPLGANIEETMAFWLGWWDDVPRGALVPTAVTIQITSLVILQISARRAEALGIYYVTILEMLACIYVLHILIQTVFCYTSLKQEDVDFEEHDRLLSSSSPVEKVKGIRLTFGLFGKAYHFRLIFLELFEVITQLTYFFLKVSRTDSFIMMVSCIVLSMNIAISPILLFRDRFYSCLFDCGLEVFYFLFNFAISSAGNDDGGGDTFNQVVQMLSLLLATVGSSKTFHDLGKYIYFKNKNMLPIADVSPRATSDIPVQPCNQNEGSKKEDTQQKSTHHLVIISAPFQIRIAVSIFFICLSLIFLTGTAARIGLQNEECHAKSGIIWKQVSPKLFFSDGYFASTRCDFSVVKSVDLSGLGLAKIPPSVTLLSNLAFLNLSRNKIQYVGNELLRLPVHTLDISDNMITDIEPAVLNSPIWPRRPEFAGQGPPLKKLVLGNNPFETYIDWSYRNITGSVPDGVKFFHRTLRYLNVSHNYIKIIDVIKSKPDQGFGDSQMADNLKDFDASYNEIDSISDSLVPFLQKVPRVNLSHNILQKSGDERAVPFEKLQLSLISSGSPSPLSALSSNKSDVATDKGRFLDFSFNPQLKAAPLVFAVPRQEMDINLVGCNITQIKLFPLLVEITDIKDMDWPFLTDVQGTIHTLDTNRMFYSPSCPLGLWGSTSLRIANFSDVSWGSGEPRKRSWEYMTWWGLLLSFPNIEVVDISNRIMQCLIPPKGTVFALPNVRTLFVRYATDVSVFQGDFVGLPKLRELDMTLYSGTSFPKSLLSLSKLEELHADWSSTPTNTTLDLSLMVSLQVLSLTGLGLTEVLLPSSIQKLFLAFNKLRKPLGSILGSLNQIFLLDYEGSLIEDAVLKEPLDSASLQCLLLGPGSDGKRHPWTSGGSLPNLRVADFRGLTLTTTKGVSAPSLRLVCVHENDMAECVRRFPQANCITSAHCKSTPPCTTPRFPLSVKFTSVLRESIQSTLNFDLPCASCESRCYQNSVLGTEPYPTFKAPIPSASAPPSPTPKPSPHPPNTSPEGSPCEGEKATQAIAGGCFSSIGTHLLVKPAGTAEQYATDSTLATLKQYEAILGAACSKSLKQFICSVPFPRCNAGKISRACSAICKEASEKCETFLPLLPKDVKKYLKCDDEAFYGKGTCFQ